ncbi:hypothetical protein Hanom_Chr16g01513461 [Helianthus anomalus]
MELALESIMSISQDGTVKDYCDSFQILFDQVRNLEHISEFYAIYLFIIGLEPGIRKIFAKWHQYSCTKVKDVISLALKIDSNSLQYSFSPYNPNSSFYNKDLEFDINITLEELMKDNELFRNGKIQETFDNIVQETIVDKVIGYVHKTIEDESVQNECSEDKLYDEMSKRVGSLTQESLDNDDLEKIEKASEISQLPKTDSLFNGFLNSFFLYKEENPIEVDLISMGYYKIVQIKAISKKRSFMLLHDEKDTGWVDTGWRWIKSLQKSKESEFAHQRNMYKKGISNRKFDPQDKSCHSYWVGRLMFKYKKVVLEDGLKGVIQDSMSSLRQISGGVKRSNLITLVNRKELVYVNWDMRSDKEILFDLNSSQKTVINKIKVRKKGYTLKVLEDMGNITIKGFRGNEKDNKNNQVQIGEKGNLV